jgi:hypothetical protein
MVRRIVLGSVVLAGMLAVHANVALSPWMPLFKGVDHAVGTNFPPTVFSNNGTSFTDNTLQVAHCVRIDLTDPDVQLFFTPRASNYLAEVSETQATSVSNFLKQHNLQVAVNAGFYSPSDTSEYAGVEVFGLAMSTGTVVSVPDNPPSGDSVPRGATLMFTSNKEPTFLYNNYSIGPYTAGVYNAVSGYYPVVTNGINIGDLAASTYPDNSYHNSQPRTALGVSQDKRYFYLMTIDGRQGGYSNGAYDRETAAWLLEFGAWEAITMDGGGSTSLYAADCVGNPVPLNHSSYVAQNNRERRVGSHVGIYARPVETLFSDIAAEGGNTTAVVTWSTASNGTSQVEYGLTQSYGSLSPLDLTPVTNHTVMLAALAPGKRYFFRVRSQVDGVEHVSGCSFNSFSTTNMGVTLQFGLTNNWKYNTANFDGINWQAPMFDDSAWPDGTAVFIADSRGTSPNAGSIPNYAFGTRMPLNSLNQNYPYSTYYFRTRFLFTNNPTDATLIFSNYVDDGAVYYLNGTEIYRGNMPAAPTVIVNSTTANSTPCGTGDATCPQVFSIGGQGIATSLVAGTNVFAVEVHNYVINSPDITFESALFTVLPQPAPPFITNIVVNPGETNVTIAWDTLSNATSQVLYGLTTGFGNATPFNAALVTNHTVTINGLEPKLPYYFRILSVAGGATNSADGDFTTTTLSIPLLAFSNSWKFTTNAVGPLEPTWVLPDYDDSSWEGEGPALLYIENNPDVFPKGTLLPSMGNAVLPVYYFRAHFTAGVSSIGLALLLTNFVDDGAIFYLNGTEVQRVRMPGGPINYGTLASDCPPNGCDATFEAPDVFRISGDLMTNLVAGDNVIAAEVHQVGASDSDVVFGSTVTLVRAHASETKLSITRSNNVLCISWPAEFLTLQSASTLSGPNPWSDLPGQIRRSPYCTTNPPGTRFYRLRD